MTQHFLYHQLRDDQRQLVRGKCATLIRRAMHLDPAASDSDPNGVIRLDGSGLDDLFGPDPATPTDEAALSWLFDQQILSEPKPGWYRPQPEHFVRFVTQYALAPCRAGDEAAYLVDRDAMQLEGPRLIKVGEDIINTSLPTAGVAVVLPTHGFVGLRTFGAHHDDDLLASTEAADLLNVDVTDLLEAAQRRRRWWHRSNALPAAYCELWGRPVWRRLDITGEPSPRLAGDVRVFVNERPGQRVIGFAPR